jgi:hypothetical protein
MVKTEDNNGQLNDSQSFSILVTESAASDYQLALYLVTINLTCASN